MKRASFFPNSEDPKEGSKTKVAFCPTAFRDPCVDMMVKHMHLHHTIPVGNRYITNEEIYAKAIIDMEGQVFFDDIGAEFEPGHTFNYPEDSEEESPDLSELNATMRIYILT